MRYGFRRKSLRFTIAAFVVAIAATFAHARKKASRELTPMTREMTGDQRIAHALNRFAFGQRSADVDSIRRMGVDRWIEQQLNPDAIPENPVLEMKLRPLETLHMSSADLEEEYPAPATLRAIREGRLPLPADPVKRALIRELVERLERKQAIAGENDSTNGKPRASVLDAHEIESMRAEEQIEALAGLPRAQLRRLRDSAPVELQRRIQMLNSPTQVVNQDLAAAKLVRAVYSNRQLEEVLTDFWYNHFNVFVDKGADRYLVTAYERDVIRPHVLGHFHDLLLATAQSPAMLFYLDNWQSAAADPRPNPNRRPRGLNENYARELMELHTLGVDGGYTQKDVTEVARCFTGWTIREPRRGGDFEFNARMHDAGEKHVLGVTIPAGGGMEDGLKVIDILAAHPSTARSISKQLTIRFVADDPPEALVERMARKFQETHGDLREVMRTMIHSPEFWDANYFRAKIKSPLELVASAVRAVNGDLDYSFARQPLLNQLGEPLYRKQEPNGYSNRGADWLDGGSLMARMNFAMALAENKVAGIQVDTWQFAAEPAVITRALLVTGASADTERSMLSVETESAAARGATGMSMAGVALASPDFQRR